MYSYFLIAAGDVVQAVLEAAGSTNFARTTARHLLISGDEPSRADTRTTVFADYAPTTTTTIGVLLGMLGGAAAFFRLSEILGCRRKFS